MSTVLDLDNYEWDDAEATETAWQWSKKLQRGKRAYGRRAKKASENNSSGRGILEQDQSRKPAERRRRGFGKGQRGTCIEDFVLSSPRDEHRIEENQSHYDALASPNFKEAHRPPMQEKSKRVISYNSSEVSDASSAAALENLDPNIKLEPCNQQDSGMEGSRVKKFRSQSMSQTAFMELNKMSTQTGNHRRSSTGVLFSAFSTGDQHSPAFLNKSKSCFSSLSRGGSASDTNFYTGTHSSFSSIRDSAKKLQQQPYDIEDQSSCMTPSRCSSVGSSRKRGVCDSPLFPGDDCDGASLAMSHRSTSSYKSRRARSRIFSPQSTSKMMDGLVHNQDVVTYASIDQEMGTMRRDHDDSGDGSDSDPDESLTSGPLAMSFDTTDEAHEHEETIPNKDRKKKGFGFAIPTRLRRMSSCEGTFEENIFVPVEKSPAEKFKEDMDIFATMSSYEDLKFLIKELRRWSVDKHIASFGMSKACIIVPPNGWKSERKADFMSWTTSHLGFSHRSGGGLVTYIQTSATKGRTIQKQLEKALLEYKKKNKPLETQDCKIINQKGKEPEMKAPFSSIKIASNTMTTPFLKASGIKTR